MPFAKRRRRYALELRFIPRLAIAALFAAAAASIAHAETSAGVELFESKIRPVFVEHCQKCHGPDKQWSGLRLDSRAGALTGGDNGPAVVPGSVDDSELIRRITETDDNVRMPPPKEGKPLNPEQIAAFKQWINAGAPWPESATHVDDAKQKLWSEHWAFHSIKHTDPPEVPEMALTHNPIDQFVIQKLDAAGLKLSPEADRRTLITRATYDLLGLPPTDKEIAEFVNDTEPNAYERLIDRLLASPRYGEQWGRHWLDIARYADTKGYVYARENRFFVNSALYRDWVINAFNNDVPYDRFVQLQIAPDQVAPDDPQQLAAMGFLTLGRRMLGVTPDIFEDRIDMIGRGLLGLTIGCARCHDHKFDPIPTADYYALYGVFENCVEHQVDLPQSADVPRAKALNEELEKLQKELAKTTALRGKETSDRIRAGILEYLKGQRHLDDYPDLGVISSAYKDEIQPAWVHRWDVYLKAAAKRNDPIFIPWQAFAQLPADQFSNKSAEVAEKLVADSSKINPRVAKEFTSPPASADEVAERYAKIFTEVNAAWSKALSDAKAANQPEPQTLLDPADEALRQVLYSKDGPCVIPDEPVVNTEYLWDGKTIDEIWKAQGNVDSFLQKHPNEFPCAVVLSDRKETVEPQIFRRGNPMNKGDRVSRHFVKVIAGPEPKPFTRGSGRLELAQAITDPTNPLTARVWANRVWLNHFGAGFVTTPSDFGVRSAPPSHPELLDWLASELIRHGWSTKWLHRTIMLSAAYRQSSERPEDPAVLATVQDRDPDNRLLWRMNPHRLTFEQFRDTLLSTTGELDTTMGGKAANLLGFRRSVYVTVDRQYLPPLFSVFDFASPDFHVSQRSETTTPQQALYALNSPYLADRARKIAARVQTEARTPAARVTRAYQIVLRRNPSAEEVHDAVRFLAAARAEVPDEQLATDAKAWSYGYGEIDTKTGSVKSFQPLPHFTGAAWQGGTLWPDSALGWAQLTAKGGHPGNDEKHAVIRRWTASASGTISIKSEIAHQDTIGDGVIGWIVSSRKGVLKTGSVFNKRKELDVDSVEVEKGDVIDFVVDKGPTLSNDDFIWVPTIAESHMQPPAGGSSAGEPSATWNGESDFPRVRLLPLEQLTQLLLCSNELMFVD